MTIDDFITTDPVELGSALFTLVEPHKGHEVAYNRWYERDHFYSGCMIGPFNFAGGRYVATRDLKELRYGTGGIVPSDNVGTYIATYWVLKGHHKDWNRWARRQVKALIDADRMFPHRDHIHTQLYTYEWSVYRDGEGVPAELVLDHPFRGLVLVWGKATDDREEVLRWLREDHLKRSMRSAATTLCFLPIPMPPGQPSDVPSSTDDEQRFLLAVFCEQHPAEVWDNEFADLGFEDRAEVLLASPFIPTLPGTDTYTDQLW